jgi:hypothetical protein
VGGTTSAAPFLMQPDAPVIERAQGAAISEPWSLLHAVPASVLDLMAVASRVTLTSAPSAPAASLACAYRVDNAWHADLGIFAECVGPTLRAGLFRPLHARTSTSNVDHERDFSTAQSRTPSTVE